METEEKNMGGFGPETTHQKKVNDGSFVYIFFNNHKFYVMSILI